VTPFVTEKKERGREMVAAARGRRWSRVSRVRIKRREEGAGGSGAVVVCGDVDHGGEKVHAPRVRKTATGGDLFSSRRGKG
jgi:uncharacterized phage protein gp47/JayE